MEKHEFQVPHPVHGCPSTEPPAKWLWMSLSAEASCHQKEVWTSETMCNTLKIREEKGINLWVPWACLVGSLSLSHSLTHTHTRTRARSTNEADLREMVIQNSFIYSTPQIRSYVTLKISLKKAEGH